MNKTILLALLAVMTFLAGTPAQALELNAPMFHLAHRHHRHHHHHHHHHHLHLTFLH